MSLPVKETLEVSSGALKTFVAPNGHKIAIGHLENGWRWSVDVKPLTTTELCECLHIGVIISGSMSVQNRNGTVDRLKAQDAFYVAPGHDAWVDDPNGCVIADFEAGNQMEKDWSSKNEIV